MKLLHLFSKPTLPTPSSSSQHLAVLAILSLSWTKSFPWAYISLIFSILKSFSSPCLPPTIAQSLLWLSQTNFFRELLYSPSPVLSLSPTSNLAYLPSTPPKPLAVYFSNLLIAQCNPVFIFLDCPTPFSLELNSVSPCPISGIPLSIFFQLVAPSNDPRQKANRR